MHGANFTPFAPAHGGFDWHINAAATLALWAFIGLESATVPAEEVKDPERTIPRATIIGTVLATVVYILATVAIMGIIPTHELAASTSPFADAAGQIFGGGWDKVIALVALVSTFGALNGWILIQGRVPLAAAQDGLFPKAFAQVSGTRKTPVVGLVASSVLLSALMGMNYQSSLSNMFVKIIVLATITTLVPYAFSAGAQLMLMFKDPERFSGRRLALDATIAVLAFAYSFWMVYGAGETYIAQGFLLLLAGIPVYIWIKWRQSEAITAIPVEPVAITSNVVAAPERTPVGAGR
jgi:APA family basic amino acid/polyamine antiporter